MKVYGIKNCDTVKKALQWLKEHDVNFEFHDYKKEGISQEKLQQWFNQVAIEELINKRGTTWRKLPDSGKEAVKEESSAMELIKNNTSLLKRPLIEQEGKILTVGFDSEKYEAAFL